MPSALADGVNTGNGVGGCAITVAAAGAEVVVDAPLTVPDGVAEVEEDDPHAATPSVSRSRMNPLWKVISALCRI